VVLFGLSTIIGWFYYAEKCYRYLFPKASLWILRVLFMAVSMAGAVAHLGIVWPIVDLMNGFMALPNLLALWKLSPIVVQESRPFFQRLSMRARLSSQ
jgi:AGCS family alanine or glycine:cation symporter